MPGIVGLITNLPRRQAMRQLARMVRTLRHEPFYTAGSWIDESSGVYVGWTAQKGSFSDHMPLRNERGDVVLVFSGEEFPEPGIARSLKARGHELDARGPSYLVHLYEEDSSFPAALNGRFHGLLVDRSRGTAMLFNDRYGMHRIYCHDSKDAFYFAGEAKAILAVRPELRRMDLRGIGEFVSCGAVLENRTLFQDIQVLPSASVWTFRNHSLERKGTYFQARQWEEQEKLDRESYYRELCQIFTDNLSRYFSGQQRIAMSLTGGLDTRMILACQKASPGSLPCYTFGSMFRENQDVLVARRVAEACHQPHQVIIAGEEFLAKFAHYAQRSVYLSDGCVDVGRAPDLYLNERAREIAPVRMTGNYGGELLRRVRAFKPSEPTGGVFSPELLASIRHANETYKDTLCGHPVSIAAFRQGPWYMYGVLALEQSQLTMRSPFLDNDFVRTVFRSPALADTTQASLRIIAEGNRALLSIPTDRGVAGNQGPLLGTLSRAVLEFLFKAEYAFDMGMPQWLARLNHALSPLRPEQLILGRHKPFHFRVWYRDVLAEYVQEMLLDERSLSRPYIERKGLESVVRGHLNGNKNYTTEIHKVLTLELLQRLFFDDPETDDDTFRSETLIATTIDQ